MQLGFAKGAHVRSISTRTRLCRGAAADTRTDAAPATPAASPMQKAEPLACSMQALPPPEPKGTLRAVDSAVNCRPPGTTCGPSKSLLSAPDPVTKVTKFDSLVCATAEVGWAAKPCTCRIRRRRQRERRSTPLGLASMGGYTA